MRDEHAEDVEGLAELLWEMLILILTSCITAGFPAAQIKSAGDNGDLISIQTGMASEGRYRWFGATGIRTLPWEESNF